jgi:hypothetical protein
MQLQVAEIFPSILDISPAANSSPALIINEVLSKISVVLFADGPFFKANRVARVAGDMLKAGEQLPTSVAELLTSNSHLVSLQSLRPLFTMHALSEFCFSSEAPLKNFFVHGGGNFVRIPGLPKDFSEDAILLDTQLSTAAMWTTGWAELLSAAVDIDGDQVTASDYRCMLKAGSKVP